MKEKETERVIESVELSPLVLPELKKQITQVSIRGLSPLIVHAWSEKAKKMLLAKQTGDAVEQKAKDPYMDFCESMYWMDEPMPKKPTKKDLKKWRFGIPAIGARKCLVAACSQIRGLTKVLTRQALFIRGEFFAHSEYELIEIRSPQPEMHDAMVRLARQTADIRFRARFWPWEMTWVIEHNPAVLSTSNLINLVQHAGFGVGLCEWRPEKDGTSGRFELIKDSINVAG